MTSQEGPSEDDPFYVGFAISVYQNSGDENSNWGAWEKGRTLLGQPRIAGGTQCGVSCDFWHRYAEDIALAANMGSNCFRLSLEWSRLQPNGPGSALDPEAVQWYNKVFDLLAQHSMEPFVTLHHFVHPLWFEQLGAFTKEGNIALFVHYAKAAFAAFGGRVKFWATFNEANVTSFAGFMHGSFPPGKLARISGTGVNMLHMLRSHTLAYETIKAMPGGADASIGIVHNWFTFEPQQGACCAPFYMRWVAALCNKMWGNGVLMRYLQTGVYDYNPFWGLFRVYYEEPKGRPGCDHFGLNYYSRGVFDWKLTSAGNPGDLMTDMPYALWPEGMLHAIHTISELGMPIYITETGVADAGDAVRPVMIQQYMEKVEEAVRLGYDLRGVMYWTLCDNMEWQMGFTQRFGMYKWDNDGTQRRTPRASVGLLKSWFNRLKETCPKLRGPWQSEEGAGAADGVGVGVGAREAVLA